MTRRDRRQVHGTHLHRLFACVSLRRRLVLVHACQHHGWTQYRVQTSGGCQGESAVAQRSSGTSLGYPHSRRCETREKSGGIGCRFIVFLGHDATHAYRSLRALAVRGWTGNDFASATTSPFQSRTRMARMDLAPIGSPSATWWQCSREAIGDIRLSRRWMGCSREEGVPVSQLSLARLSHASSQSHRGSLTWCQDLRAIVHRHGAHLGFFAKPARQSSGGNVGMPMG